MKNSRHVVYQNLYVAWILLHSCLPCLAGELVADKERGFELILPDGFKPVQELVGVSPAIVHAFGLENPNDGDLEIILMIEELGGVIGRERLNLKDMPPGFQGKLTTMKWKDFVVDCIEVPEQSDERAFITLNAQIPIKPAAIQVKMFGPENRRVELTALLATTLSGLDGESNWIPSAIPAQAITSSENYGTILICLGVVFVLSCLIVLWVISKWTPKGTLVNNHAHRAWL